MEYTSCTTTFFADMLLQKIYHPQLQNLYQPSSIKPLNNDVLESVFGFLATPKVSSPNELGFETLFLGCQLPTKDIFVTQIGH